MITPPDMRSLMQIVLTEGSSNLLCEKRVVLDDEHEMVVWENPSAPELRLLITQFGSLRGHADLTGPLIVWNANTWVHHTIQKYLGHFPIYLYFAKGSADPEHEEWHDYMRKRRDIIVGVKYNDDMKPNAAYRAAISNPNIARAIGVTVGPEMPKGIGENPY